MKNLICTLDLPRELCTVNILSVPVMTKSISFVVRASKRAADWLPSLWKEIYGEIHLRGKLFVVKSAKSRSRASSNTHSVQNTPQCTFNTLMKPRNLEFLPLKLHFFANSRASWTPSDPHIMAQGTQGLRNVGHCYGCLSHMLAAVLHLVPDSNDLRRGALSLSRCGGVDPLLDWLLQFHAEPRDLCDDQ